MPASSITMYDQFYKACRAFPEDQWNSILAAFTTVVAGSPSPSKVCASVLAQPNPMHVFAYFMAMLNLTLEHCQSSDSWMLVSLLPDLEVSDLKKSQSNHKSNTDILSLHCLKLYHKCSEYLYSAFKDPNQYYDLWVHSMVLPGCMSTFKWV